MKPFTLINAFAQRQFNIRGWEGHYSAGDTIKYDGHKDALYLQRDSKTKLLTYFRYAPRLRRFWGFDFGMSWKHWNETQLDRLWFTISLGKTFDIFHWERGKCNAKNKWYFGTWKWLMNLKYISWIRAGIEHYDYAKYAYANYDVYEGEKMKSKLWYIWQSIKMLHKQEKCNHPNIQIEAHVNGDSGSEDYYCPDCRLEGTHIYY